MSRRRLDDAQVLRQLGVAADLARTVPPGAEPPTLLRLRAVSPETSLAALRSETVDHFVSVRATVTRVGPIKPLVTAARFSCAKCGFGQADDALATRRAGTERFVVDFQVRAVGYRAGDASPVHARRVPAADALRRRRVQVAAVRVEERDRDDGRRAAAARATLEKTIFF